MELHWSQGEPRIGGPLLLDTCVYIDMLQSHAPASVDALLESRPCNHSAVCLAEMTHLFGRLDPRHPATPAVLRLLAETIEKIPDRRLYAPDARAWGEAGLLAGEIARLRGSAKAASARRSVNDALIFLQARHLGASVLTRNVGDFDALEQLAPGGHVVFYRRADLS